MHKSTHPRDNKIQHGEQLTCKGKNQPRVQVIKKAIDNMFQATENNDADKLDYVFSIVGGRDLSTRVLLLYRNRWMKCWEVLWVHEIAFSSMK